MQKMTDAGGLGCQWSKPNSDITVWYARLPVDADSQSAWESELAAAGWTEGGVPVAGTLTAPADYDVAHRPVVVFSDGAMHFSSDPDGIPDIAELQ